MKTLQIIAIGLLAGFTGSWIFQSWHEEQKAEFSQTSDLSSSVVYAAQSPSSKAESSKVPSSTLSEKIDFTAAAARTIPSVVYINSISQSGVSYSIYDMLFGNGGKQTQVSSGSGVIFTQDGYVITNNHVVETAEKIEVLYNKKVYVAELIGTDPSTDLAVLKIKENGLPAIVFGSSASLNVGEWVVAVGNPFSLTSTVTVGIVSAKGRSINVVSDKFPIESFIQTDAAINPGNSGGALVNKEGALVGINTAILSRTGSYTGYAFAVPADIVKKVATDIIKFGVAQKAILGCEVVEYDFRNAEKFRLSTSVSDFRGVLVSEIAEEGAARSAGLKPGDVILKIDNVETNSRSSFEEELSYRSPGDQIKVIYLRGSEQRSAVVTLLNRGGNSSILKRQIYSSASVGANLEAVEYGVKVFKIKDGLFRKLGIPENYTIISINRQRVRTPEDVVDFFERYKGRVLLYGVNSSKQEYPLQFYLQ